MATFERKLPEKKRKLYCFKAYDVRGKVPEELDGDAAYRIGCSFGAFIKKSLIVSDSQRNKGVYNEANKVELPNDKPQKTLGGEAFFSRAKSDAPKVVLGCDIRPSSLGLKKRIAQGLYDEGIQVIDLGWTGTEEVYFATISLKAQGGLQITGSHNPIEYNGIKFVVEEAQPLSSNKGLPDIRAYAESLKPSCGLINGSENGAYDHPPLLKIQKNLSSAVLSDILESNKQNAAQGTHHENPEDKKNYPRDGLKIISAPLGVKKDYVDFLLNFIRPDRLSPLKVLVNGGHGMAGPLFKILGEKLFSCGVKIIEVGECPDGNFPQGIPNPMIESNQQWTSKAVIKHKVNFGVAFDGDFDRCFFFDHHGQFIQGYYIVGLLAESFLKKSPGASIVIDPRLTWNTLEIIKKYGGKGILCPAGHAFIKAKMREVDAVYGGEMSAHHYFKDFAFCDSGMIPWLLVLELLSLKGKTLQEMVQGYQSSFPCSGELNYKVKAPRTGKDVIEEIKDVMKRDALGGQEIDGLSLEYTQWRFNVRCSNTEPLLRLNIETRGDMGLLEEKKVFLENIILKFAQKIS